MLHQKIIHSPSPFLHTSGRTPQKPHLPSSSTSRRQPYHSLGAIVTPIKSLLLLYPCIHPPFIHPSNCSYIALTNKFLLELLQHRDSLTARDYDYPSKHAGDRPAYYNGSYTSPRGASLAPRSPVSRNQPAGSMSPPTKAPAIASPTLRQSTMPASINSDANSAAQRSPTAPSVLKAPAPPTNVCRLFFSYLHVISTTALH